MQLYPFAVCVEVCWTVCWRRNISIKFITDIPSYPISFQVILVFYRWKLECVFCKRSVKMLQVAMMRCGQPLTTMASKRSREDEKLVNATLGSDSKGIIIDTRSQTAAMNSRTKGKWKKSCIPWSACLPHPYAILVNFVNKRGNSGKLQWIQKFVKLAKNCKWYFAAACKPRHKCSSYCHM